MSGKDNKTIKAEKRANALRENLRRRKEKAKATQGKTQGKTEYGNAERKDS